MIIVICKCLFGYGAGVQLPDNRQASQSVSNQIPSTKYVPNSIPKTKLVKLIRARPEVQQLCIVVYGFVT